MIFPRTLRPRLANIENLAHGVSWADAISLSRTRKNGRAETSVLLRMLNRPVIIRPGTSDLRCLRKVFVNQEYMVPFEANPGLIIDAGANIGLASLFFANTFPRAEIIAIEPEPSNYDLLTRNCAGVPNVTFRQAAIWNQDVSLRIANPDAEKWEFTVKPDRTNGSAIKGLTIPQILAESGHDTIEILKLDVEGAELQLFSDECEEWLPRVKILVIELHDRTVPGCGRAVYSKVCRRPFLQEIRGENIFFLLGREE